MNEEKVTQLVEEAMNPETFDVLAYLREQPVATDEVDIYTHLPSAKRLSELLDSRQAELQRRREAERKGEASTLSLADADEDTEFDTEINELTDKLEQTKLTFKLKTVAPSLEKAITKSYAAKADPNWEAEERNNHEERKFADILARAIDYVVLGNGVEDRQEWTSERLSELQEELYVEQSQKLLTALSQMVYTGSVFEEALTADFS